MKNNRGGKRTRNNTARKTQSPTVGETHAPKGCAQAPPKVYAQILATPSCPCNLILTRPPWLNDFGRPRCSQTRCQKGPIEWSSVLQDCGPQTVPRGSPGQTCRCGKSLLRARGCITKYVVEKRLVTLPKNHPGNQIVKTTCIL